MRQCLVLLVVVGLSLGMELGRYQESSLSKNMENYAGDIVTNMNHRSGVYDSPMAQDYYVR